MGRGCKMVFLRHNLVDTIRAVCDADPDRLLFQFLNKHVQNDAFLNAGQLVSMAQMIAATISRNTQKDDRVILAYPAGLGFIEALVGTFFSGRIAVPLPFPNSQENKNKLINVARDCNASLILSTTPKPSDFELELPCNWFMHEDLTLNESHSFIQSDLPEIAFLQYTSGSTGRPKGVKITHQNIIHNFKLLERYANHSSVEQIVSWLPHFHDLGLITGICHPLLSGMTSTLMDPMTFYRNPLNWLQAISQTRATTSAAPNFAYQWCVDRISDDKCHQLDLSHWAIAGNGAERISSITIDSFVNKFGKFGFKKKSFFPCYGMAESTLLITGVPRDSEPILNIFKKTNTNMYKQVQPNEQNDRGVFQYVSVGRNPSDTVLKIMDPETHSECSMGQEGEIWFSGQNVGKGYWNDSHQKTFTEQIDGQSERYLRTGDIGFLMDGELYITGRIHDQIILKGKNWSSADIETQIQASASDELSGHCAAVPIEHNQIEELWVFAEVKRQLPVETYRVICQTIRHSLMQMGLNPAHVKLIKNGRLPKTSSGKIKKNQLIDNVKRDVLKGVLFHDRFSSISPSLSADQLSRFVSKIDSHANGDIRNLSSMQHLELQTVLELHAGHPLDSQQPMAFNSNDSVLEWYNDQIVLPSSEITKELTDFMPNESKALSEVDAFSEWMHSLKDQQQFCFHDSRITAPLPNIQLKLTASDSRFINFTSYNYLGLATHPKVIDAAKKGLDQYGLGAASSPIVGGTLGVHKEFEERLIDWLDWSAEVALFPSGYTANTGAISALFNQNHTIILDEYAHASLVEGARLAQSRLVFFKHNDADSLKKKLEQLPHNMRCLVATEGLFSSNGEVGEVERVLRVAKDYGAITLVDEAHSMLCMGDFGRGITHHVDCLDACDLLILTFSKSFAGMGGGVVARPELAEYIRWYAKSRMFSCALDPAVTAGMKAGLDVLADEGEERRYRLNMNVKELAKYAPDYVSQTASHVICVPYGSSEKSIPLKLFFRQRGIEMNVLQAPAAPKGQARLRLFVSSEHTLEQMRQTADVLNEAAKQFGMASLT